MARTTRSKFAVEYLDDGPDKLGRRRYFLYWTDREGVFRPEPSKSDGKPVGYRRAQIFFTDRAPPAGARVLKEGDDPWHANAKRSPK